MAKNNKRSLKVGKPLPKNLGMCADFYHEVQQLRLAMEKEVATIQARESEIREHIIENLAVGDKAKGSFYKALVTSDEKPTPDDWAAIYDYVYRYDRYDLLAKKLNAKAVEKIWDEGEKVPGVKVFHAKKVSITKI